MEKEYYQGTKSEGWIEIPNNVARSAAFCEWVGTRPAALYIYLQSYVVRGEVPKVGGICLYKDYFLKGKLVARWSQRKIAEHFNKSQSVISRHINQLVEAGFIKIHSHKVPNSKEYFYIYELGTHNHANAQTWYMIQHFALRALEEELEKESVSYELE